MKTAFWTCLALAATANAEPRLMEGISNLNVNNNISDAIVARLYPDWHNDSVATTRRLNADAGTGSFHFLAGAITIGGYYTAIGYDQIGVARKACRSRGTAEDGTFACLNSAARATCGHATSFFAAAFSFDSIVEYIFGTKDAEESKEKTKPSRSRRRACSVDTRYSTDYSFAQNNIGIKHTAHQACTLFPRSQLPYLSNVWSQMGEICWAEHSALSIQWTMYDAKSGNVFARWHSEIDTVATDICPLYVSGSGCKF